MLLRIPCRGKKDLCIPPTTAPQTRSLGLGLARRLGRSRIISRAYTERNPPMRGSSFHGPQRSPEPRISRKRNEGEHTWAPVFGLSESRMLVLRPYLPAKFSKRYMSTLASASEYMPCCDSSRAIFGRFAIVLVDSLLDHQTQTPSKSSTREVNTPDINNECTLASLRHGREGRRPRGGAP